MPKRKTSAISTDASGISLSTSTHDIRVLYAETAYTEATFCHSVTDNGIYVDGPARLSAAAKAVNDGFVGRRRPIKSTAA